jgi:hypothetical protein
MIRPADLIAFHDDRAPRAASPLWEAIEANHRHNGMLWAEEDLARRRNAPDSEIAANKRAIDGFNQKRNDAVERVDELLLKSLESVKTKSDARLSSETAGAMIDRLSILSLKIRAMRLQTERKDVDQAHVRTCRQRLERLTEQRADLAGCLERLLAEAARGESYFKVYRQFKMYNDPKLNPAVYGEDAGETRGETSGRKA